LVAETFDPWLSTILPSNGANFFSSRVENSATSVSARDPAVWNA
jgi:hypothetical protein